MAPQQVVEAFNAHLNKEFYAAYLYLSMAAYCQSINLPGFARWLRLQSQEESSHAMKFFDFLDDRGARVQLAAIQQPPVDFQSPQRLFEQVLAHEQTVTREIDQLYGLTVEVNDYASQVFLQWFITEQVEEEKTASEIVETLKLIGDNKVGLIMLDKELGQRGGEA